MKKPVNNTTKIKVVLGGVSIAPSTQRVARESLITEEEKAQITEQGLVIEFKPESITVKSEKDELDNEEDATKKTAAQETNPDQVEHYVYPKALINANGDVSGSPAVKKRIEAVELKYGEIKLLSDNEFESAYPEEDVDAYRVEEEKGK